MNPQQQDRKAPSTSLSWTGKAIVHLSLHKRASPLARLDVLPFVMLYAIAGYGVYSFSVSRFVAIVIFCCCVIAHILALLAQQWSVRAKAFISWARVKAVKPSDVSTGAVFALLKPRQHRGKPEMVPLEADAEERVYFLFQKRRYEYNANTNAFEKVRYPTKNPVEHYVTAARATHGLSGAELLRSASRFGTNKLDMPAPTFMELYIESLLAPFFVFQVFCIFLWLLDEYWKYSLMTLGMMLLFEATVVFGRLRSLKELRGMRNPATQVYAYRNHKWNSVSSLELLPGDIISIGRGRNASDVVPCDLLILSGSAVVNEAMLTGESVPLMKEAISAIDDSDRAEVLHLKDKHKVNVLFGGTRILTHTPGVVSDQTPVTKGPDNGCICYVLRTGFGSSQGNLMRTILFSTESVSANSSEAAAFILFLVVFAVAASGYVLYHRYTEDADARYKLLLRCVLIITSVVPPELPMQLALAVNTSLIALVKNMVFCTEPYRIPFAGKIDVCCFDKTGTITTDSIQAVGVALPQPRELDETGAESEGKSDQAYALIPVDQGSTDTSLVLAACHSLVHADNELIGDPLELAALKSVQWTYGNSGTCVPKRGGAARVSAKIMNRYRFASALQRMSVVAEIGGSALPTGRRALVKGSPEAIGKLLKGDVLPHKYLETARRLARGGMRVLALAYKELPPNMTVSQVAKLSRSDVESDLSFAGFVCFECPLRHDSRKVIRMLKRSSHDVAMITGDATLTAAHVATQVEMCTKSVLILEESEVEAGSLEWFSANSGKRKKQFAVESIPALAQEFDLCVSGPALQMAMRVDVSVKTMFRYFKVFARMSPDQKENILTSMKEAGLVTLMCGDGTNDVGALKQAHVGVALLSLTKTAPEQSVKEQRGEGGTTTQTTDMKVGQARASDKPRSSGLHQRKKSKPGRTEQSKSTSKAQDTSAAKLSQQKQREKLTKDMENLTASLGDSDDQPPLVKLGDASIASPFTSRKMTIDSCTSIIRQGRCTLATTLQTYQILALNSLISAYSLSVLYLRGVKLGDKQLTIIGLVLAVASFMVSRSKPLKKLAPVRPASTVFAPELFISLLGQFAVHVAALIMSMRYVEPYITMDDTIDIDGEFEPSLLNTVVFLLSVGQQIAVYVLNYKGRPHMQGIFDNRPLLNSILFASAILAACTLEVSTDLNEFMELVPWPSTELQMNIAGVIIFDLLACFVIDRVCTFLFRPRVKTRD